MNLRRGWSADQRCVRLQLETADSPLFVCLSSHNVYPAAVFEFARLLDRLSVRQVLLRDPHRLWYYRGVPGLGASIEAVHEFLAQLKAGLRPRRIVTLGTSAGGYAAILFGLLLQADEVLAFAPQTRLTEPGDSRTPERIEALHALVGRSAPPLELSALWPRGQERAPRVRIYYSEDEPLDVLHARRLEPLTGVQLQPVRCEGHRIIPHLKRDGRLSRILEQAARG